MNNEPRITEKVVSKKMTYEELYHLLVAQRSWDVKETQIYHDPNTTVASELFPGTFAYCLNETFFFERFGGYLEVPVGTSFRKIQSCIRDSDFKQFYVKDNHDKQHLASFDLSTVHGGYVDKKCEYSTLIKNSVEHTIAFLTSLGLEKDRIYVSCFGGGTISEVSKGRHNSEQYLPPDTEVPRLLVGCGIPEKNIIFGNDRDTFLMSNFIKGECGWGFRNEINYLMPNGEMVDIATIEHLLWKTVRDEHRNVLGVEEWEKVFVIDGCGLERLLMVVNNEPNIRMANHIYPLVHFVREKVQELGVYIDAENEKSTHMIDTVVESIRAVHRILNDAPWKNACKDDPRSLTDDRKMKVRQYFRNLLMFPDEVVKEFFIYNASLYRTIYPELGMSAESVAQEFVEYRIRKNSHRKNKNHE